VVLKLGYKLINWIIISNMSEFGKRSELGRKAESDKIVEKRPCGDWSKNLVSESAEMREHRHAVNKLLESREAEVVKSDLLGECKGESDMSTSTTSPFTKSQQSSGAHRVIKGFEFHKDSAPTTPAILAKRKMVNQILESRGDERRNSGDWSKDLKPK